MGNERIRDWTAVVRVLDAPGQVFRYLVERPALLPPYIIGTLIGAVATAISLPVTLKFMESEFAARGLQASPTLLAWASAGGALGGVLGPLLGGFFTSALVFGILWMVGQEVTFRGIFSIIGYARLPLSVGLLINGLLIMSATSTDQIRQISLSAAVFASSSVPPFFTAFLSTLAPFDLWYFALVTLGVSAVTGRPASKLWWIAAILYGLKLLMTMLGSGLSVSSI